MVRAERGCGWRTCSFVGTGTQQAQTSAFEPEETQAATDNAAARELAR